MSLQWPPTLPSLAVTAYSCFDGSQPSAQLGLPRRPRNSLARIECGLENAGSGGRFCERKAGLLEEPKSQQIRRTRVILGRRT